MESDLQVDIKTNLDIVCLNLMKLLDECETVVPWFGQLKKAIQVSEFR